MTDNENERAAKIHDYYKDARYVGEPNVPYERVMLLADIAVRGVMPDGTSATSGARLSWLIFREKGNTMKDYMKRAISSDGWNRVSCDPDLYGRGHSKRIHEQERKEKRRARRNMRQQLKNDCMDW